MSSQKKEPPKGQQSLFAFFGKAAPTSQSSSQSRPSPASSSASKPKKSLGNTSSTPAAAPSTSSPAVPRPKPTKVASTATASTSKSAQTTPAGSEAEAMDVDSTAPSSDLPSDGVKPVPSKRAATSEPDLDEDEEEDAVLAPRKKNKAIVLDSDSEEEEPVKSKKKVPVKASASKKKKGSEDDAFEAGSGTESEDYFNDGLSDFLVSDVEGGAEGSINGDLEEESPKPKPKPKPKAAAPVKKSSPSASSFLSRPAMKSSGSGSGGIASIKTKADLAKEKEKETKKSNEKVFSFLADIRDADKLRPTDEGYDPRTLYIPKSAWSSFTPFETQFWEIKQNHFDTVLFFQKGKFFELYENDAAIGHQEFDLKLTDRVKMKMVGVPEASFDFWAAKFLAQGYKVGRVDQCETALGAELRVKDGKKAGPKAKGPAGKTIVRRELKSVLTSGTIVDGSLLTDDLANHCVAVKQEYTPTPTSSPSFGICVLDASTAEFQLSSFSDDACRTQLETLLRQLKPKELIHEKGNLSVSTLRLVRSCVGVDCQWTALKGGTEFLRSEDTRGELRKLFKGRKEGGGEEEGEGEGMEDESEGDEDACVPENIRAMYDKPVAMSALGGMIWYLRQLNLDADLVTTKNFNIYDPLSQGQALILDGQTLAHIEVLQNSQGGQEGTLFQLLSRCVTPFGKRLFKIWLCAPLRQVGAINDRLDAVEDLMKSNVFSTTFDAMAKKLPDLERMLSRIHAKSCKKQEFLKVVSSFERISTALETLTTIATEEFKSTGVPGLLRGVPDFKSLLDEVKELFEGDELLPVDGKDEDYERVKENVEKIEEALQKQLRKAQRDLECTVSFKDIGTKDIYQLEVPVKVKVPSNWTKMSSTKAFNRYWSPEVTRLVSDLKEARERKTAVVNDFQYKVYGEFDKDYSTWLDVVKVIAELDCLMSLSKSSQALGEPAVRPEIVESDQAIIEFEELRHPCVLSATTDFIPNDVALGGNAEQMILLTGPNMAGKSTLLRMTCAAIIMAQLGCYVPASKARIAPVDAIYSRMGANDFIFANASTFKVEMDDCNKILTKATPRSLVILDELGRGTSTYDGMAIAYAVLHRLATHVGCVGFFATHFTSLTEDFAYHSQIRLCNMQTQVDDDTRAVVFLYKLINGSSPKSYGPHVASMAGLPDTLVQRAISISKQFETTSRAREREMRANESLPLTLQADAAFLVHFAKLGLAEVLQNGKGMEKGQLRRTLEIIREGVRRASEGKIAAGTGEGEASVAEVEA
ncbi:muts domain V-domain-containing protein [Leucosporidium creatinivorum]|uniref:DNA mismatch repair protein n=1 Tax=Leucosporidium creatinivorum TaxID=106004 RepID=A0A1Y2FXP7_9BASI|nr:muts domain V-domain-containing protein [Leucosporidium creatinivorum]